MIQEEKPLKAGKKLLALLLTVCMLLCMLPTVAFASGSDYLKIAMLDSGRKYFSADWVKAFLYEAKADGYTHVMLAVGNDGMRFLLDDMSLSVGGKTYSSDAVASAIRAGNNAYTTASSGEWTESEMDEFFATAKKAGIEIIPLLNSPGHMDSVLYAASSLTGTNCSYNGSSRTIDVTNDTAVRFSQAFLQKYVDYFAGKGCRYFNFGADEYANDRYTSGSMGFGSLQNSGKYGYFIKYVNELAAMVKQAGMTPIAFNDGIEFANKMSASVGSTTYTFDRDIVVCYWSGGWSGYTPRTAANLASDGFRIINTTGDFYYVLGKNDSFDNGYTYAANWSNYKVCGTSLSASSVIGGMFCMWSDYPGAETQTQEAKKIRLPLRAMGLAMDGAYTSGMDTSVVPGGFNADGSINTDPPAQSHDYRQTASTAATCTEAGSVTYTCADCGDSYTETVPALGHDYAAADDAGDTIYTCTRCGEQYSELLPREYVSVKTGKTTEAYTLEGEQTFTHTGDAAIARGELTVVQGTGTKVSYSASASASVPGYTDGGYNCVASKLIDGDTSTYYWSTSSQTSGMYARVDLGAEVRFDAVQISAPAHGDYCTNANVQLSSDGRTWTTIGTFTSSRSTAVTKTYAVPSSVESFRYIQVALTTARNYWWQLSEIAWGSYDGATFTRAAASGTVQTGTAPMTEVRFTGVAAGTTYYVIGGTRYVIEVEADHIHSYQEVSRTTATCTEDGVTTYRCETCGDTYIETTPATGHSYTAAVTAPTCTEKGYTTYTCTVCGDHYTANEVAALGHDYKAVVTSPTCTEKGYTTYTCKRCGEHYTADEVAALGHDYKAVVTAPTCTEKGYTTYTCATCGDTYTADEVAALGHDYEAVVTAPTCTEDGYTTYTCRNCGDRRTGHVVSALGHSYECTENGNDRIYTCTRCGDTYTEAILPTVEVKLQPGETYTFHTEDAAVTESADPAVAATTIEALSGGYQQVTELAEGTFLLVSGDRMLTATASTYYSSWDGAGTVSGLTCAAYSTAGDLSNALWTVTAVSGGYTVQSADGRYLNLTESTRSASVTLTTAPQVLTITDLGSAFSIRFSDTYLDRYSTTFAGAYPGNANANERWQLYRAVPAGYDVTITGVAEGATRTVIGGVRYAVTVHAHAYTATVTTAATCTTPGVRTYACACGESYTEEIPAMGHSYVRTEENGNYVYTCSACGDSYSEPVKTATYDSVSRLTSGGRYVLTVYAGGGYYAMTHDGTTIGAQAVTIENGRITSDVTESMLWDYSNGCFSFQSGTTTYYLYKSGNSSLRISTSGTSVSYWYNRLGFGNAYLRYSNGSFYLTRWNYSYCYLFQKMN